MPDTQRVVRGLDVVIAFFALCVSAPLMGVICVLIRIDSPGPAIFRQRRVGRFGIPFTILKFRTMSLGASAQNRVLVEGADSRVTRIGRLLRKSSLDELPQLWNVLKGDMSLVGPRPIVPEQMSAIPERHTTRFDVRPGLTGLAQVTGRRGLTWPRQLERDSEFANDPSLRRYLSILARTAGTVVRSDGVYGSEEDNWRAYQGWEEAGGAEKRDVDD